MWVFCLHFHPSYVLLNSPFPLFFFYLSRVLPLPSHFFIVIVLYCIPFIIFFHIGFFFIFITLFLHFLICVLVFSFFTFATLLYVYLVPFPTSSSLLLIISFPPLLLLLALRVSSSFTFASLLYVNLVFLKVFSGPFVPFSWSQPCVAPPEGTSGSVKAPTLH